MTHFKQYIKFQQTFSMLLAYNNCLLANFEFKGQTFVFFCNLVSHVIERSYFQTDAGFSTNSRYIYPFRFNI